MPSSRSLQLEVELSEKKTKTSCTHFLSLLPCPLDFGENVVSFSGLLFCISLAAIEMLTMTGDSSETREFPFQPAPPPPTTPGTTRHPNRPRHFISISRHFTLISEFLRIIFWVVGVAEWGGATPLAIFLG